MNRNSMIKRIESAKYDLDAVIQDLREAQAEDFAQGFYFNEAYAEAAIRKIRVVLDAIR
ncbi:hypothetical protein I5192_06910 [Ruegeria sp. SCSIO 43209]|uniref:hypothetical protein n=1 Tax=Ruegeria sp. SCSIO 43209 TaxID=2793010 RepID=UPI001CA7FBB8|nr:hypothetical protein [Ruegeria sp. SCSIO 43209]UAB90385.1 hypothetical protein I5192_06910 [Ruegeria sp. SCSIO 43209]